MLTPAKIKNHHFESAGRNSYKSQSVDSFFEEVSESFEQMFRENGEMYKKINLLAERIEEYRKDEDNIRNALINAQRLADKITKEAQNKADEMVAQVTERTSKENEVLDARAEEYLADAKYQAKAIIEQAQEQAKKILDDATKDSKEASISARSEMIKEEATLEMMKSEVSKFKKQIVDLYNSQFALIEQLPEIVAAKIEQVVEEPVVEETPAEEQKPVENVKTEEPIAEESEPEKEEETVQTTEVEEAPAAPAERAAESMNIDELQQMIEETEDTIADSFDDDEDDTAVVETGTSEFGAEFVIPEIEDDYSEEKLQKIVEKYDSVDEELHDIPISKNANKDGFKVNFENIDKYSSEEDDNALDDDFDDDDDDDDDDNGEGFASKLKGFFRK